MHLLLRQKSQGHQLLEQWESGEMSCSVLHVHLAAPPFLQCSCCSSTCISIGAGSHLILEAGICTLIACIQKEPEYHLQEATW